MRTGLKGRRLPKATRRHSLEWATAAAALLPLTLVALLFSGRMPGLKGGLPGQQEGHGDQEEDMPGYGPELYKPPRQEQPWRELGRLPPDRLVEWRQFAEDRQCSTNDADYAQIFRDLAPFRAGGGVGEGVLDTLAQALPGSMLASLGGGAPVRFERGDKFKSHTGFWGELLGELTGVLPPIKLLLNVMDEPRSWVSPLPPEVEELMRNHSLTEEQVWHWRGCDSVSPDLKPMKEQHGMFASRLQFHSRRGLLPIFSSFKVPGCFADILIPAPQNNPGEVNHAATHSACPLSNATFESKRPVAIWRGSTTGATYHGTMPPEQWEQFQRQRLVALSQRRPDVLDAGFTAFVQCAANQCDEMEKRYGKAPSVKQLDMFNGWHFQMVVDGNGAPTRLLPTLCSGSLTLLSSVLVEWYYFRLRPFTHYLPVRPDYSDLPAAVQWARERTGEAKAMAAAASHLVNTQLRREDMLCYTYRLLLEYADLYTPAAAAAATTRTTADGDVAAAEGDGRAAGEAAGAGGKQAHRSVVGQLLVDLVPSPPIGKGFEW